MPARLKSLELQGYKTFAARSEFMFAERVTAIVGPNGSGKSNIADAIRWVLGEQSYLLLRGKKTEDMIFAGSEQRARAGMASATIVFDNSDGWLPIDFAEVAIARHAYRDGQNEYLINGQRVRLKDVSELLSQSGLAERTYTIIGQGLVDAALALKAEDRRRLFEEAAGIGLHRARREDALKRLETTRRNLERVEDILAELQPRLRSLEKQARRAQEYEQVKGDLNLLLRDWYGYHWHLSQKELTDAQQAAAHQEAQLDKARLAQAGLDQALTALREQMSALREQLNAWHRQSAELHSQREALSRRLAVTEERERSLGLQQTQTQTELARLSEEFDLRQERLAAAEAEVQHLQAELEDARAQGQTARQALQARLAERDRADRLVQTARQALSGLNARQGTLSARISERKSQAERQQETLRSGLKAIDTLGQELAGAETRLKAVAAQLTEAESGRQRLEKSLQEQRAHLTSTEAGRKTNQDRRATLQGQLARFKAQLDVLEQAEKSLAGYASGAKLLIQAMRQSKLKGAQGVLSSQLEASAEVEAAVSAALGEYLDALVLSSDEHIEESLRILESGAARGALLPLNQIRGGHRLSAEAAKSLEGCLGVAADLVRPAEGLRPVVDLLLGQTLVVRDRGAAQRLLASAAALGAGRVVTLRGEVFSTSGPILGGQEGKPGSLSRPRERRELQEQIQTVNNEVSTVDGLLREQEAVLARLNAEEATLRRELQAAQEHERRLGGLRSQEELAADKARRSLQWQREQHSRAEAEIARSAKETEQLSAELSKLEGEITQAREQFRTHQATLSALSLDEFQSQVAHWNTRLAVTERAAKDAQTRLAERSAAVEQSRRSQASLQTRIGEYADHLATLTAEKEAAQVEDRVVEANIQAIMASIQPVEAGLTEKESEQKAVQVREAEARQTLSHAEHFYAQTRINLARRQETLENLRQRIEDDFGIVAFKYDDKVSGPTPLPLSGFVEHLPVVVEIPAELEENIKRQRAQLRRMGPINPEAQTEYQQVNERYIFLTEQVSDLKHAQEDIKQVLAELDTLMQHEFQRTFEAVAHEFRAIFSRLFGGGTARLVLTEPENLTDSGIDIEARLPGRREQGLTLLSGGERSLTAAALVFALLKVSPTPFCVLDEVDAMLDEANVGRFRDLLSELSRNTQFVVVTHNRNTVQAADVIYGVTMGADSASQVISLRLDQVAEIVESQNN